MPTYCCPAYASIWGLLRQLTLRTSSIRRRVTRSEAPPSAPSSHQGSGQLLPPLHAVVDVARVVAGPARRHAGGLLRRSSDEGEPVRPVSVLAVVYGAAGPVAHAVHRADRGTRMARCRPAADAAPVRP